MPPSLAYVAMPLVLTAIDLKLSSSSSELHTRRRRLDALGEIVRHSGNAYDVTDFVSTGTNHILQLAYITSQHLFLGWDRDTTSPASKHASAGSGAGSDGADFVEAPAQPYMARRAKNWYDAFLQCPRAYLLISTSVDYSLAVGRLPGNGCLPELVRSIPPMGVGIRLPWTVCPGKTGVNSLIKGAARSNRGAACETERRHDVSKHIDQSVDEDQVNLDYFRIDVISISSSSPHPDGVSDDGAGAAQNEAFPGFDADVDLETTEWQLDDGDLFDPFITSMVQDYIGVGSPAAGEELLVSNS